MTGEERNDDAAQSHPGDDARTQTGHDSTQGDTGDDAHDQSDEDAKRQTGDGTQRQTGNDAEGRSGEDATATVSRRRLLRTGVNVGLSATLVWAFGADYVSSAAPPTITYAMARPDPDAAELAPRTKEVPYEWYESLRVAFDAQDAIREAALSPLVGSFIVPGDYSDAEATISVDATDESVAERIEDIAEGVDISLNVLEDIPPRSDDEPELSDAYRVRDLDPGRVPGGVLCRGTKYYGTLAPPLFDAESGSRFFATSNHVFGKAGTKEDAHRGEPLRLAHDERFVNVGTVAEGLPAADVVKIDPVDDFRPASVIERATPSRVVGHYTKVGLADLMARDEPLRKVGAFTGTTTGSIKGIGGRTAYTGEVPKVGQLKWGGEDSLADGDSGSVNFHEDPKNPDDYVLVGGINNARTWWPGADFTWGTAAHHLLDEYGLHF